MTEEQINSIVSKAMKVIAKDFSEITKSIKRINMGQCMAKLPVKRVVIARELGDEEPNMIKTDIHISEVVVNEDGWVMMRI